MDRASQMPPAPPAPPPPAPPPPPVPGPEPTSNDPMAQPSVWGFPGDAGGEMFNPLGWNEDLYQKMVEDYYNIMGVGPPQAGMMADSTMQGTPEYGFHDIFPVPSFFMPSDPSEPWGQSSRSLSLLDHTVDFRLPESWKETTKDALNRKNKPDLEVRVAGLESDVDMLKEFLYKKDDMQGKPPTERPPTEKTPTERPPTERPPKEKAPTERPPKEMTPTEQPPPTEKPPQPPSVAESMAPPRSEYTPREMNTQPAQPPPSASPAQSPSVENTQEGTVGKKRRWGIF